MNVLDITSYSQKGAALREAINSACKEISKSILPEMPDVVRMTTKQYGMLVMTPAMQEMFNPEQYVVGRGQQFFLYKTPYNVMEVEIKDADVLDLGVELKTEEVKD